MLTYLDPMFGLPIAYRLSDQNGGKDPEAAHCASHSDPGTKDWPHPNRLTSDCVGLVMWAVGLDRYQPRDFPEYSGWMNSDSVIAHARAGHGAEALWKMVDEKDAKPGDVLAMPSRRNAIGQRIPGHVGVIVRPATPVSKMLTVDCSPSHGRLTAIGLREPWSSKCVVVRYAGLA